MAVSDALSRDFIEADIETSVGNGRLLAYLAKHGEILSRTFTEDRVVTVHCRVPRKYLGRVSTDEADIRPRENRRAGGSPSPIVALAARRRVPHGTSKIGEVA